MRHPLFWVVALVCVAGTARPVAAGDVAIAHLNNPQGEFVGIATLMEGDGGVTITVNLRGMPPGVHALHIHAAGSCEKPDFKTAKGHFNPYGRKHGLKNPDGAHAGDLPNITIAADGTGALVVTAPLVTLGDGPGSLFHEGGTAIMIHSGPDDYVTDPTGAAGPRIACGVIQSVD